LTNLKDMTDSLDSQEDFLSLFGMEFLFKEEDSSKELFDKFQDLMNMRCDYFEHYWHELDGDWHIADFDRHTVDIDRHMVVEILPELN